MAILLWTYIDTFLGRLRSVQRYYMHDSGYYLLQIYEYMPISDKLGTFELPTKAEVGVDT